MKPRASAASFLLAILSLLLTFSLLELALRLLQPERTRPPRTGVRERHHSNWKAADDRLVPRPDPDVDPFTLLVAGDSFTWGAGVYAEDAYPHRLENGLHRRAPGSRFRVITVARPGWGTTQELAGVYRRIGLARPDLLILGYCLNDAEPVTEDRSELVEPLRRRRPSAAVSQWLWRRIRLYRWAWERIENTRQRRTFDAYYRGLYEGTTWDATRAALGEFSELARRRKIPWVVVVFPVFDDTLGPNYRYRDLHAKVVEEAERLGALVLDLLPTFEKIAPVRLAVEPFRDPHPNELAHRITAQRLERFLIRNDLVPVGPRSERELPTNTATPATETR